MWLHLLERQGIPLHADVRHTPVGLSAEVLQAHVLGGHHVDRLWLKQRRHPPRKFRAAMNEHLLGMDLLEDRWLLVVYAEGIHLWDLDSHDTGAASLTLDKEGLTFYTALYDSPGQRILIAAKKHSCVPFVLVVC